MMPFPPPSTDAIDWDHVGFHVREVNGHIESHYDADSKRWSEPVFIKDPYLKIHGLAPGLNYGQQVFEGLKAYRTADDEIAIFRPSQNAARMAHSTTFLSIPIVPPPHFLKCVHLATALNAEFVPPHHTGAALYIRPLLLGSSAELALIPPSGYTFCVYVLPVGVYHGVRPVDALVLEEFDRAAPEGTGSAKIGGNYAPVLRWSEKAKSEGFGITLHLDSKTRTVIDEFSTAGFIGIHQDQQENYTLVVPNSKSVIKSVTSDSVCEIARSIGWKVEYRPVPYDELPSFSEIVAAGTAAALVPIKSITMRSRGDKFLYRNGSNEAGPATVKLLTTLKGIQQGKIKDSFGWLEYVKDPAATGLEQSKPTTNGVETDENVMTAIDHLP